MSLNRRLPRQVAKHLARYLSLTMLIALGSILLITLNLITDTLQYSFDRLGEVGRVEDVRAWLVSEPVNLDSLGRQYHIEIESRTSLDIDLRDDLTLRVFDRSEKVDRPVILDGRNLVNDHEILLNPAFATEHNLKIGDMLTLSGFTWRICGFFSLPDYIYPTKQESELITDAKHFGIAVISRNAMKSLVKTVDLEDTTLDRSYGIRYLNGAGEIKKELKDRYGLARWLENKDNARISMVKGEIAGLRETSSAVPAAFFLLNCALLASILWRMIRQEFAYIGTMRALGLGKGELLRHYLLLPLAIAVTGSIIGTVGGLALARPMLVYYTTFFNLPLNQTRIDFALMLASILIPIALLMTTAIVIILRAVRLPPQALIRGYKRRPKAMMLEKLVRFHRVGFETKFRIRQMVRSSGKLLVAVIGVAFATMLVLSGFMAQDSYDYLMDQGLRGTFQYSQNYVFKSLQKDNKYGGEPYQMLSAKETGHHEAIIIQGIAIDSKLMHLTDQQGQTINLWTNTRPNARPHTGTGFKTCVISRVLADKLHLETGNTMSWVNDLDDQIYFMRIGAIAEIFTVNAVYMPIDEFNRMFDLPEDSFIGIFSKTALDIDSDDLYLSEKTADALASLESYAGVMKYTLLGMGLVSSLMALLILYILIALLIEENSRSIALLKILGYDTGEIRHLILRIFDLPFLIGYAIGIPMLFNFYGSMLENSFQEIDMTMPLRLSTQYLITGFVMLYATYFITRTMTGRKIFRISMADGLKTMQE